MTNVIFPSSGGTIVLNYSLDNCSSSESVVIFEPQENWYSFQQDSQNGTVTLIASAASDNRSGSITVSVNGSDCTLSTIVIQQDKETVCDCNSFLSGGVSTISVNYIIPSSGVSSGEVIGHYFLDGCSDSSISFGSSELDLSASNGDIILMEDIAANPSTDTMIEYHIYLYYGVSSVPCFSGIVPQEASEVKCSCSNVFNIVHTVHKYFSNLDNTVNPNYTPLNDVMILSASTACGEFVAKSENDALSTWIKGQDVPDKVLLEESGGTIYAYVTLLPQSTATSDLRTIPIDIKYKIKNPNGGYDDCDITTTILTQSGNEYWQCRPDSCSYNMFKNSYYLEDFIYSGNKYCKVIRANNTSEVMLEYTSLEFNRNYNGKHIIARPRLSEVGYCDAVSTSVTYYDEANLKWIISNEQPVNANLSDWVSYRYYNDKSYITFLSPNTETNRFKYVKIDYDIYTDYDSNFDNEGILCCTALQIYCLQGPTNCCDCNMLFSFPSGYEYGRTEDYHEMTETKTINYDGGNLSLDFLLCNTGAYVADVYIYPSSAGTVTEKLYDVVDSNSALTSYTYTIYENNTKEVYKYSIHFTVMCGEEECDITIFEADKEYNPCSSSCNDLSGETTFIGYTNSTINTTSYSGGWRSREISSDQTSAYSKTGLYMSSTFLSNCSDNIQAYMVICDENGNNEDIDDIVRYGCNSIWNSNQNGYKFLNHTNKGWRLTSESDNNLLLFFEVQSGEQSYETYRTILCYYYKIKYYSGDTLLCESQVYARDGRSTNYVTYVTGSTTCDAPSCSNISSFIGYTINSSLSTTSEGGITYIIIPKAGGTFTLATLDYPNGKSIHSINSIYCTGYALNYAFSSTTTSDIITCSITNNGYNLSCTISSNPDTQYRTITCELHTRINHEGTTTPCNTRTIYIRQLGQ